MKKLRVWWIQNPPNNPQYFDVENVTDAIIKLDELANNDLQNESIISNVGGLEIFENNDWYEYYDDEGRDIWEIIEDKFESLETSLNQAGDILIPTLW
ncbi:MAG: hypothetical protein ACFFDN_05295 [Candidatus Hodarchaeota archaeon]